MKKNKSGFSIIIGMGLVILITMSAFVILAYIVPFSRGVKGIENASNAYYVSYSGIEKALYHIKTRATLNTETGSIMPATPVGYSYNTFSSGSSIPLNGDGNSEYNSGFNIISLTEPLQLQVGFGYLAGSIDWNSVNFLFRVPDLDNNSSTIETLSGNTLPIINWMLSSENDTLVASGTYLTANDIKNSTTTTGVNYFASSSPFRFGSTLSGSGVDFQTYYSSNCGSSSGCSLKFSIINPLELNDARSTKIPYLEYKITGLPSGFPDRYTKIKSSGKSYGFQKNLEVKIPQQTVNQAFDFTIFQ